MALALRLALLTAIATATATGCHALPLLREVARPEQTMVSPAGQDGTRYIAVEGGPLSSSRGLRARWRATARRACEGDYEPLSEGTASRRQGGVTRTKIHEGFVQCLIPGETEPGMPGAPSVDDATAKRAPRRRGAMRRASSPALSP